MSNPYEGQRAPKVELLREDLLKHANKIHDILKKELIGYNTEYRFTDMVVTYWISSEFNILLPDTLTYLQDYCDENGLSIEKTENWLKLSFKKIDITI